MDKISRRLHKIEKDGKTLFLSLLGITILNVTLLVHIINLIKK